MAFFLSLSGAFYLKKRGELLFPLNLKSEEKIFTWHTGVCGRLSYTFLLKSWMKTNRKINKCVIKNYYCLFWKLLYFDRTHVCAYSNMCWGEYLVSIDVVNKAFCFNLWQKLFYPIIMFYYRHINAFSNIMEWLERFSHSHSPMRFCHCCCCCYSDCITCDWRGAWCTHRTGAIYYTFELIN